MDDAPPDLASLARRAGDAVSRGDLEAFLEMVDPEVEFTSMIAEMEGETYRGHDGVRRWWAAVREAFEEGVWDYQDIRGEGELAVARLRIEGRLRGIEVAQTMWQAFRVRDGLALWWGFYRTEEEALEAVGLGG